MPYIPTILCQPRQAFLLVMIAVTLAGCAITIQRPADNITITLPSMTQVVIAGDGAYWNLKVTVDGVDISNQMVSTGQNSHKGNLSLAAGTHTITASAEVSCPWCNNGKTQTTDTTTFVVSLPAASVCFRPMDDMVKTIDPQTISIAQQPGRKAIAFGPGTSDAILIIVDDAPDLQQNQMRVEIDIDPTMGVTWNKAIEAWALCKSGSRVDMVEASWLGGEINVGIVCSYPSVANDMRTGCTKTQTMVINQSTTSELWLRKPGFFGVWFDVVGFDSSIWQAFGGRSVRFLWRDD